jgi:hypothetical protein
VKGGPGAAADLIGIGLAQLPPKLLIHFGAFFIKHEILAKTSPGD